jgi:hypothetical protein
MKFNSNFILSLNLFNFVQTWKLDKLCQVLNSSEACELGLQIQVNLIRPFIKCS